MMSPSSTRMTLGGMICPSVPEAQIVPVISRLSYPRRIMVGSDTSPMVMTLAPTIPVDAARMAPTTTTEIAMPPRSRPNSRAIVSSSSSARPDFSSTTPMKTNSGTAMSVTFVIVPQMRKGRMSKKSGRSAPVSTPSRPKKRPVKVRLKATGKPTKRNAIIPANITAARICSGGILVHFLHAPLGLFPAPGHVEVLDRLRHALQAEQREADDDHRLENPAHRHAARIGRSLVDVPGVPEERRGGVDHEEDRGKEEQEREGEVGPGLAPRRPGRVEDVDADVLVVEHRVPGRHHVADGEQVPLHLLHEHGAATEPVPQHHVD